MVAYTRKPTKYICKFDQRCECYNSSIKVSCDHKNITGNNIPHFPRELHTLLLGYNLIERIPPTTFNNMSNLFELDLSWNRLVYLDEGTFDGLASLRKLFLNGNLNYSLNIPNDIFKPLVSLTYLNVAYNLLFREGYLFYTFPGDLLLPLVRLYKIEVDVRPRFEFFQFAKEYRTLTNLKRLKTGFCILHHLTNITFTNLLYLEYIEMQTCWIQKFDRGTLPNRNYFRYLDISHNELSDYDHDSLYSLMNEISSFKELRGLKMTNSFPFVYIFKPGYLTFFLKSTKI